MLVPLNMLSEISQAAYKIEAAKYESREVKREEWNPILQRQWGDTIFLTATHPQLIDEAFKAAGYILKIREWLQLNSADLDKSKLCIYWHRKDNNYKLNYAHFDEKYEKQLNTVGRETYQYLETCQHNGLDKPFILKYVPHVLYKGELPFSATSVIKI